MIITRTPFRISFFGGGTDYPVWYRQYGGAVLSTTIDKSCYITCRHMPPFFEYHSRVSYSKVENVGNNDSIEHPSVRACLKFLEIHEGVGAQDQVSAAYGGFNRINFNADGTIEVKRILTAPSRLLELEQHLALYFTGFSRTASEIAKEQIKATPHKE